MSDLAGAYIAALEAGDEKATSYVSKQKQHFALHVVPYFPTLDTITPERWSEVKGELRRTTPERKGLKHRTIYRVGVTLRLFLRWAVAHRYLPPPAPELALPDHSAQRREAKASVALSPQQRDALLAGLRAFEKKDIRAVGAADWYEFLFFCPLRAGAARTLTPSMIEWRWRDPTQARRFPVVKIAAVNDKTAEDQIIPLHKRAAKALERQIARVKPEPDEPIFGGVSHRGALRAVCKALGLPALREHHDCRHTGLTHAAEQSGSFAGVQALGGHKSAATTQKYVHAKVGAAYDAVRRVK